MSISHFSLYEASQTSDFISKLLKPRSWQKRKAKAEPQALDFPAPKKGFGRWFGIRAEPVRMQRQLSAPTYLDEPENEPTLRIQRTRAPQRCVSAMELCNPSTFVYPKRSATPEPTPWHSNTFPTTPSSKSYYDNNTPRSRQSVASFSSIPSIIRPGSVYYTPSDHSHSTTMSTPSSAYFNRHTPSGSTSSHSSFATSIGSSASSPLHHFRRFSANPLLFENSEENPDVQHEVQAAFDSATSNLSKALDLPLVYLVALDLSIPDALPTLTLLSSIGLPSSSPNLSPSLHFQALRAPEGGLLYRAPEGTAPMFTAGVLIPVMEVRRVGYVLAAYTNDSGRELESRDVKYVTRFAEELETWVARVGRAEV
ncbi:hypothetical protein RQP46_002281 [Phenoliferia psychrophenolica]